MSTKERKKYEWRIPPERRAALNAERVAHMRRGREQKRATQQAPVNTPTDTSKAS